MSVSSILSLNIMVRNLAISSPPYLMQLELIPSGPGADRLDKHVKASFTLSTDISTSSMVAFGEMVGDEDELWRRRVGMLLGEYPSLLQQFVDCWQLKEHPTPP